MRPFFRVRLICLSCPTRLAIAVISGAASLIVLGCCAPSGVTDSLVSPRPPRAVSRLLPAAHAASMPAAPQAWARAQTLYQQAEIACRHRQYARAADLLARLASQPGLTAAQTAFVQEQRAICLHDAGRPAPAPIPVPASLPDSIRSAPAPFPSAQVDCGPRALLLLCRHEGITADLPHLRQLAGTTKEGTSLAGLERAAKAVGLKAEGVQVSREALPDVEMPALAYVNGNHFIAVLSVQGKGEEATATVQYPNNAKEHTISQERLLRLCSGYLLTAHR